MDKILDQIRTSIEVKKLDPEEPERLCYEVRGEIISTVSRTGGHLASNLGVVELTVALHYVFDFPRDKLIWDVGHQSYAHKLLTGRRDHFHTLRQYGGISGFPKRDESPFDAFDSGHSGTSISSALGMAEARRLKGIEGKVIAVIGDGSMTGGLSFEGLNQAGHIGVSPFIIETGDPRDYAKNNPPAFTEVFGETLCQLARENKRLIAITAAMQSGTGLERFARNFPDRFYDIGIAEQHAVTFAAGLALEGMKPVVAIYSTFLQRAYDQILQDVCLQNLPVVFALDRGGIVGEDGPTHHGLFDFSYLRHIPNLIVMAPKDENEFRHMIKTAIDCPGPVAIRYPRGKGGGVKRETTLKSIDIAKGEVLREGEKVLILAIGSTVYPSVHAAERLEKAGISAAVINSQFLKPLDGELLSEWAIRIEKVLTVEENVLQGGFGSAVLELFQERGLLSVQVKRLGIPDLFVEHGSQHLLRAKYGINEEGIVKGAREMVEGGWSTSIHSNKPEASVTRVSLPHK